MTGIELIAAERERQMTVGGWDARSDDIWDNAELSKAASCYTDLAAYQAEDNPCLDMRMPMGWPWDRESWKPSVYPIRNLVKAGALLAAEIDRLQRAAGKTVTDAN